VCLIKKLLKFCRKLSDLFAKQLSNAKQLMASPEALECPRGCPELPADRVLPRGFERIYVCSRDDTGVCQRF